MSAISHEELGAGPHLTSPLPIAWTADAGPIVFPTLGSHAVPLEFSLKLRLVQEAKWESR